MSDAPLDTTAQIRALTVQLKGLGALHSEITDATAALNSLLVFTTHPDLPQLDYELDNLYPGASG